MISRWHIPITGFTQNIGAANGFDRVWHSLRKFANERTSVVTPLRWRANFDQLAEFIFRQSDDDPDIDIYSYSWGCGHGAIQLTKELRKRGLTVDHMVLCDPVYHSWVRPWRALFCSPAIKIPSNVREVSWLRQFQNKPQGTHLVKENPATEINSPIILKRNHEYMDDSPEFHKLVLKVAEGAV